MALILGSLLSRNGVPVSLRVHGYDYEPQRSCGGAVAQPPYRERPE